MRVYTKKANGDKCPGCGHKDRKNVGVLVKKTGLYGSFLGCSHFPRCRYTKKIERKPHEKKLTEQQELKIDQSIHLKRFPKKLLTSFEI
jgi:ssDNA-binding Zn-finger/Zn-ribbon topoisomerase 1